MTSDIQGKMLIIDVKIITLSI